MAHLEALLGREVEGKDGTSIPVGSLEVNEILGLYFSAHWCGPCRNFTPVLAECYKKVKAAGKKWEIIFMSLDKDLHGCKEYYNSMPWLLFPFDSELKEQLSDKFEVQGIPSLIFLDPKTGDVICKDAEDLVMDDENGERFPWK